MQRKKMDKKMLKEFEQTLLERREKIMASIQSSRDELAGNETVMSDDISEGAKNAEEDDVACLLAEAASDELAEIDEALERMRLGSFGVCEGCDEQIPFARLEAIPNASLCLKCKQDEEKSLARNGFVKRRKFDEDSED